MKCKTDNEKRVIITLMSNWNSYCERYIWYNWIDAIYDNISEKFKDHWFKIIFIYEYEVWKKNQD